jgi:hypothetical protein
MSVAQCLTDLDAVIKGVFPHGTSLLLATGKAFPFDTGDYRACTTSPVSSVSHYFLVRADVHLAGAPAVPMGMGLCVPASCAAHTMVALEQLLAAHLPRNTTIVDPTFTQAPTTVQPWDAGATLACVVLGLLTLCSAIGTLSACIRTKKPVVSIEQTATQPLSTAPRDEPLLSEAPPEIKPTPSAQSCLLGFFGHFNVSRNCSRMLAVPAASPTDALNGMRVLSMVPAADRTPHHPWSSHLLAQLPWWPIMFWQVWIILGHSFLMPEAIAGYSNPTALSASGSGDGRQWTFQLILGAELAVDIFFFLSSFLFAHIFLKARERRSNAGPYAYARAALLTSRARASARAATRQVQAPAQPAAHVPAPLPAPHARDGLLAAHVLQAHAAARLRPVLEGLRPLRQPPLRHRLVVAAPLYPKLLCAAALRTGPPCALLPPPCGRLPVGRSPAVQTRGTRTRCAWDGRGTSATTSSSTPSPLSSSTRTPATRAQAGRCSPHSCAAMPRASTHTPAPSAHAPLVHSNLHPTLTPRPTAHAPTPSAHAPPHRPRSHPTLTRMTPFFVRPSRPVSADAGLRRVLVGHHPPKVVWRLLAQLRGVRAACCLGRTHEPPCLPRPMMHWPSTPLLGVTRTRANTQTCVDPQRYT